LRIARIEHRLPNTHRPLQRGGGFQNSPLGFEGVALHDPTLNRFRLWFERCARFTAEGGNREYKKQPTCLEPHALIVRDGARCRK
jgi:hypothetical protein